MLIYSWLLLIYLKHFILFKVIIIISFYHIFKYNIKIIKKDRNNILLRNTLLLSPEWTTSVLIATALIYTLGAGITAAAGTRLALQLLLYTFFCFVFIPIASFNFLKKTLVFVVTTSSFRHRVIYAPAAFLGSGSHFSGSLSGIEPLFPVTRY